LSAGTIRVVTAPDANSTTLAEPHAELGRPLSALDEHCLKRPSLPEGWAAAELVLHMVQTDFLAAAPTLGQFAEGSRGLADGELRDSTADLPLITLASP
jgi:hypothetical protein